MKRQIDKKLLFQILLAIAVCVLITIASGCRTGGTRLNPNSAWTIIRTSDGRPNFQPLPPVPIAPPISTPVVITNTVRSNPVQIEPKSAEANPVTSNPEPAGQELKSFTPTVSENQTLPARLPQMEEKVKSPPTLVIEESNENSVVVNAGELTKKSDDWCGTPQVNSGSPKTGVNGNQPATDNLVNLLTLFIMPLLAAIGFWVLYGIIKDYIQMKKQGTPIKDHLDNLKKPAKGTRESRQKAIKKPAKKKAAKKKTKKKKG